MKVELNEGELLTIVRWAIGNAFAGLSLPTDIKLVEKLRQAQKEIKQSEEGENGERSQDQGRD